MGLSYQLQIGNDAFSSCPVSELTLPGGTIVGQNAFSNCTSLTKLVFRESYSLPTIEQIEISQAASEDRDIHKLDISWQIGFGSGKSAVNANAFSGCTALKSVTFPMNLTSIGDNAFNGCAALTEAFYPLGTNAWSAVNVSTKGNTSLTEAVEMLQNGENTNSVKRFLVQIRPDTSTKWKNAQQEYVTFKPAQLRQSKTIETEVKSKDYYIRICSVPDHSDGVAIYGDWSEEKHIQVTNVVTEADVKKSVEEFYKGLEEYRKALNKAVRASKNNYKTSAKTPGQVLRETDEASDHRIITFTLPDGKGSYALSEADKNDVYDAFAQYLESLEAFDIGKIKASSDKTMTKQAVAIVNQIKKSIENASEKKQYTMPSNKTVWIDPTGGFSDTSAGTIRMSNHPTYVAIYVPEKKTAETMNAYLKNLADCVDELLYESLSSVLSELMDVTGGKQFLNEKTDEIIKEIVENGYGIGLMSAGYGDLKKVLVGYRDTKKLLDSIKNATTRTNLVEVLKDSENIWKQIEEIDLSDEAVDNALIKAATDKVENLRKTVAHSLYCYTYGLEPDEEVNKFVMKLRKMGIACPVDFTITKSNGMVVGKVVNGRASFEPQLSILIDGNTKEVWMPADATYRISFTGTGSGSMSYTVQDYANGEVVDRLDYYDIPLEEGTSYAQKISSGDLSEQVDLLTLNSGSQEYIPERRTAEDEEDPVYVKVTATALAGGSISESASGGDMLKGDIVHLKAVPDEGYEFAGWYLDDILKESREDYYFAAVTDTSLEARFVKKSVVSSQYGAQISDEYKEQLKIVVIDNNDTPQADPSEGEDESSVRFIFNNNKEQTGEPEETITVILLQYDGQNGEPVRVTASLVLQEDGTYLLDKIDLSNYEKIEVESADGKPMGTLCGKEQIHKEPCPDGEHLFEETEEKAATYTEEGIIKKVCIFCNLELTETIPVMEPKSINEAEVTGITNKVYTGKALTQTPVLKIGSDKLEMGKDYTLSYKNNKNAGTATMTITGKDVYSGTMTKTFKINPAPISKATISGLAAKTYTGKAITQKPVVKSGTTTLKEKTDYTVSYKNNKNAGTATVNIAGKGNYTGSKSATFKINKASIAKAKVTCPASKVFTGSALTPVPTVKLGSVTLKKGTNFSLSYKNNKNVGTASITITGKGNYSGTLKKTFKILPKATSISKLSPGNKKLTVNWKKQASQTTGYQIQYSSRTDFKTQKTITVDNVKTVSKAISGLAKKHKYYVRVRTFKTVGKTKYYSAWSAKKAATTK